MTTCKQCSSDVTENDAFCPYCGIMLQKADVSDEGEDAFASTIIMAPDDAVTPLEESPSEIEAEAAASAGEEPEPVGQVPDEPIADEPPTPPALEELQRTAGSLFEVDRMESDAPAVREESIPESQHMFDDSIRESDLASEPPTESDIEIPDETVAESEWQPLRDLSEEFASERADETAEPSMEAAEPAIPEIVGDDSAEEISEPEIAPPDEALELPDEYSGPSMFDSVRIIDDKYRPSSIENPLPAVSEVTSAESGPEPSPAEALPQTRPNIGLVDTDGRRSAKLKPLDEGIVLNGRYEIVRKIGGGGMGAVYLASDNNLGGVLRAVKEMVQAHIEEEQQAKAIEDFRRESMILSQLDHPSIPTIYDYFYDREESRFYLVMKYISGGDLSARLRAAPEGRLDEKTVTEWALQMADVLDYLHNQPATIVYRDLKPSNIMIDGNSGKVMLIDFGIARSINQREEKGVTAVGTMGYAPPELFSGNVEPRSDIYSLGSTVFHLLTGADPQSNPLLIFDFQKNPRPRQINPQLSDQIERFIMRSVEYNADSRFSCASEVRQYLNEHLSNLVKGTVTFGIKEAPASTSLANQPVFCGFCGQRIVATDLFCAFCGAKQPIAQPGVHSEVYARSKATAKLVIEGTSDLDSPVFSLEKPEILIGRRDPMSNIFPEVDLSKYDPQTKISRRHARIWREGNTYLLEDLGSSNGTLLLPIVHESMRLQPRQPHALTNGDKIRVGDTTLHFVVG